MYAMFISATKIFIQIIFRFEGIFRGCTKSFL